MHMWSYAQAHVKHPTHMGTVLSMIHVCCALVSERMLNIFSSMDCLHVYTRARHALANMHALCSSSIKYIHTCERTTCILVLNTCPCTHKAGTMITIINPGVIITF